MKYLILFKLYPPQLEQPEDTWSEAEDYQLTETPPQVGVQYTIQGTEWTIAQIDSYPTTESEHFPLDCFYVAVCTEDGSLPTRSDWFDPDAARFHAIYIGLRGERINPKADAFLTWIVLRLEFQPRVGEVLQDIPEWYVHGVQTFEPEGQRPVGGYNQVLVYWCERNPNPPSPATDWEVCRVILPDPYTMPLHPHSGQVLFYVELTAVQNLTIAQTLTLLQELGFTPELRYGERQDSEGRHHISLYALLCYEQHAPDRPPDYLPKEWEILSDRLVPTTAVHLCRGLPPRRKVRVDQER